jgi:integral membrane sensor domain MASE1
MLELILLSPIIPALVGGVIGVMIVVFCDE